MTMTRMLRAVSLVAALVAGALAPAAAQNKVSVGLIQEPPGLDPTIRTAAVINYITMVNVFEGLTKFKEDGTIAPNLASKWDVSPDGKTYTFHLLKGVKFADGSDFTAKDVKWTFERNAGPNSQNNSKRYFTLMEKIETPDAHTVVIQLKEPNSLLLFRLAWGGSSIVSEKTAATNVNNPIGTGAFMLDSWVKGGAIRLKRNPHYRNPAAVKLDTVTFTVIQEPSAQVAALQAGDVDVFPQMGAAESIPLFESNPNFVVHKGASESEVVAGMNNKRKPFTDARVRRAILLGINRANVMQASHFGYGRPIGSHFSINHPAYVDLSAKSGYNPEEAKRLLAEAGYPNGLTISMRLPDLVWTHRGAEVMQADLRKIGVTLKIEKYQWAQWLEVVFRNRDYDMMFIGHVDPMDIAVYADDNYFYGYDNKAFKEIWRKVETATTQQEQYEWMRKAQEQLAADLPVAYLYQTTHLTVARKGLVGIWKNMPHYMADMTHVYWEKK